MYSNGQGFYITLPSESSKGLFPENNASEYIVRLPHWIHLKTEIEFTVNSDGKVTITLRDGYRVRLRREQAIVLGFMNFEVSTETYYVKYTKTGSYKANLHRETNILVYCNIVQPQIVGDRLIPLVATVPYQKTSESYDETFYAVENIYYIPVQTKAFQNVKVHLRSSTEEPIPFEHGRATITLHLKPLNYFD